ncbi:PREDICTED: C-C motif chemokine 17-like isoform X1 [Poecilia mexicana]|uniref:C-C motif chemokine 17-like isoform X1 n=1 Tax=Poecilia mexicana TaxID=48701 RepID=UPI00072EEDC6|nr:PREDICTED: C-C motif chemokine 17-like isoform X1 [Poecilia mexicana]
MFMLQTLTVLSLTVIFLASVEGKGVQMQRDVQCCMLYSQGKVRTKDVLRFEVQTEGPDCSIQAIILYTKKAVKCADPRDRKVKRLLRKLLQRQRLKNHRTMWLPRDNLPAMSEVRFERPCSCCYSLTTSVTKGLLSSSCETAH